MKRILTEQDREHIRLLNTGNKVPLTLLSKLKQIKNDELRNELEMIIRNTYSRPSAWDVAKEYGISANLVWQIWSGRR